MKNEKQRTFLLITIPILALFVCFNTIPLIRGALYSFTNFKGFGKYDWVGLRNYIDLFTDRRVGKSYVFTFKLAVATTIVVNIISLILALALNAKIRAKSFFRAAYFLPNILGALVVGYIFNYFFTYIVPAFFKLMEVKNLSASILSNPKKAWIGIMIVCAWQAISMNTIIYISGLQTVPQDVYEASNIDGAGKWRQFWSITFPLIMPFFTINMVLSGKNFLMVFDQIMALTKGGPAQSTESISYLIYNNGLSGGQFGFQSANAVIFFILIVAVSVAQMKFTGRKEEQL
jgi:raffinose/stachyose/melibiose transport system permease protein